MSAIPTWAIVAGVVALGMVYGVVLTIGTQWLLRRLVPKARQRALTDCLLTNSREEVVDTE